MRPILANRNISARKISNHDHPPASEGDKDIFLGSFSLPAAIVEFLSRPSLLSASSDIVTGCIIAFSGFAIAATFVLPDILLADAFDEVELDERLPDNLGGPILDVPRPLRELPRPKINMNARLAAARLEREALLAFDAISAGRDEEVPDFKPNRRRDVEAMDRMVANRLEGLRQRTGHYSLGGLFPESNIDQDRVRRRKFRDRLHGAKMSGARRRVDVKGLLNDLVVESQGEYLEDTRGSPGRTVAVPEPVQVVDVPTITAVEPGLSVPVLARVAVPQDISDFRVVSHHSDDSEGNEKGQERELGRLDNVEGLEQQAQKVIGVHEEADEDVPIGEPGIAVIVPGGDEENGAEVPAGRAGPGVDDNAGILVGLANRNLAAILDDENRDRAMEALGLTGPIHGLFTKAAVIFVSLDVVIAVAVWLLFTIGKTLVLLSVNPIAAMRVLHLPTQIIRCLSNPLVDGLIRLLRHIMVLSLVQLGHFQFNLIKQAATALMSAVCGQARIYRVMDFWSSTVVGRISQRIGVTSLTFIFEEEVSMLERASAWVHGPGLLRTSSVIRASFAPISHYVKASSQAWETWKVFVAGDGPRQRIFSVVIGYFIFIGGLYLASQGRASGSKSSGPIRASIRRQLRLLKVVTFVLVEFLVFPLTCGLASDFFVERLLPDAHMKHSVGLVSESSVAFLFYCWVAGFMSIPFVTIIVIGYRTILRPGALWFLPPFQGRSAREMVRDMLHRRTVVQLRNVALRGVIYVFMIGATVGSFVGALLMGSVLVPPFRWDPPFSTPIGLLFLTLASPHMLKESGLRKNLHDIATAISRYLAAQLRLTAYLFGRRAGGEERTRRSWIAHICSSDASGSKDLDGYDGSFRRVPNANWPALGGAKGAYATVAVTPTGEPVDDAAKLLMLNQDAQLLKGGRSIEEDYIVVYIPPHFVYRTSGFFLLSWVIGELYLGFSIWAPIIVGRTIIRLFTAKDVHDGYSIVIGSLLAWLWCGIGRNIQSGKESGVQEM
ncbi:hypothetical protein AAF712_003945 [Marasmius tenuissimus]|uniref:RING-type E3 ubiquitin transferase n=1 Tax=Marasmius tenuissimus TaxID=585030 RepID=A0ABR3A8U9_9AGAR